MPSVANKAVLIQLGVFLAENNVRRNIAAFNVNVPSLNSEVNERAFNIQPTASSTYTSITNSSILLIRTSIPLTAVLVTPSGTLNITINSLFVFTAGTTSIALTNPSTTDVAQVSVVQC